MNIRRPVAISAALIFGGSATGIMWIRIVGYKGFLPEVRLAYVGLFFVLTALFLFTRFVRWQFLLRRFAIRVPTKSSLSIYFASLAGTVTPAYVGEAILRSFFMRRDFGVDLKLTAWVVVAERLLDFMSLAIMGLIFAHNSRFRGILILILLGSSITWGSTGIFAHGLRIPRAGVRELRQARIFFQALFLSLFSWLPAALLIFVVANSLSLWVAPLTSMSIFCNAESLSGLSFMPGAIGSSGLPAILQLQETSVTLGEVVFISAVLRFASTGVALTASAVFLVLEWRVGSLAHEQGKTIHFDDTGFEYEAQFKKHVWDYLLNRKITLMTDSLPKNTSEAGLGLDLGCGLGLQCLEMKRRGYRVIGIDLSRRLLGRAHQIGISVANGSALSIPFTKEAFDFVYAIGVLHHLPDAKTQALAFEEAVRVLKPGGFLIVHETNTRNLFFRFYMGYIFPILRSIDEGVENWIDPGLLRGLEGLRLVKLHYFTFLPDFVPKILMKPFRGLERILESSPFRTFSAHYMAILQKDLEISDASAAPFLKICQLG